MPQCVVSERHRFIWLHVGKNASSTLKSELTKPRYAGVQRPYAALAAETRQRYFTFVFLRDPVSRLLSAYQEVSLRAEQGDPLCADKPFAGMDEGPERFGAFLDQLERGKWDGHLREQSAYVEGIPIGFWGCVERLEEGLGEVYGVLGLGDVPDLPHRRSREGRKREYGYARHFLQEEDLAAEVVARIREIYARDVALYAAAIEGRRLPDAEKTRAQVAAELESLRHRAAFLTAR